MLTPIHQINLEVASHDEASHMYFALVAECKRSIKAAKYIRGNKSLHARYLNRVSALRKACAKIRGDMLLLISVGC